MRNRNWTETGPEIDFSFDEQFSWILEILSLVVNFNLPRATVKVIFLSCVENVIFEIVGFEKIEIADK